MLLLGMVASATLFGILLSDFSPGKLVQVIQGAAVATLLLNGIALWKQETRHSAPKAVARDPGFSEAWAHFTSGSNVIRRLIAVGVGTMAFSMEEVLLEPYGGQILGLSVSDTTKLTGLFAIGGLIGFGLASRILSRGFDPFRMAGYGVQVGIPGFAAVILAAPVASPLASPALFAIGTFMIGAGAGLFGHGTLTATMNLAPPGQRGLALGAWGAVQATAAGLGIALGGVIRDIVAAIGPQTQAGAAFAYNFVYGLEIALLALTLFAMMPLLNRKPVASATHTP